MGYLLIDHRTVNTGDLQEYTTTTCKHCSSLILYKTRQIGLAFKKVRVSMQGQTSYEEVDSGYFCTRCNGDLCYFCGVKEYKGEVDHHALELFRLG